MRRALPALVLTPILLLTACGGGGGSTTEPATADPAQLMADLQTCFAEDMTDLLALTELFDAWLTDPESAPLPEFDLAGALTSGGVLPWTYDLDGDGVADLRGDLAFLDAGGGVFLPFSLTDLLGGAIAGIEDVIALLEDGESIRLQWELLGAPLESGRYGAGDGSLRVFWTGSEPAGATGDASLGAGACSLDLDYEVADLAAAATGGLPRVDGTFTSGVGRREIGGTLSIDGEPEATVRVALPGQPEQTFRLDLRTGTLGR